MSRYYYSRYQAEQFPQTIPRTAKDLEKTITDAQKYIFEKFQDCWSEYASLSEAEIFSYAFKLGMRIAIETLTK